MIDKQEFRKTSEIIENNGVMHTRFHENGRELAFNTRNAQAVSDKILTSPAIGAGHINTQLNNTGYIIELLDQDTKIIITEDKINRQWHIKFQLDKYKDFRGLLDLVGLDELLHNIHFPTPLTVEDADQIIKEGKIKLRGKDVLIRKADDIRTLRYIVPVSNRNKLFVFHGTSLTDAFSIALNGLQTTRATLSSEPEGMPAALAENRWEGNRRTDPSGYGALVVFDAKPEDLEFIGDNASFGPHELQYMPAHGPTPNDRIYQLKVNTNGALGYRIIGEIRYMSPDKIKEIILMRQLYK